MWIIDAWLLMAGLCLRWIDEAEQGPYLRRRASRRRGRLRLPPRYAKFRSSFDLVYGRAAEQSRRSTALIGLVCG
jgi:hypothetical protein